VAGGQVEGGWEEGGARRPGGRGGPGRGPEGAGPGSEREKDAATEVTWSKQAGVSEPGEQGSQATGGVRIFP